MGINTCFAGGRPVCGYLLSVSLKIEQAGTTASWPSVWMTISTSRIQEGSRSPKRPFGGEPAAGGVLTRRGLRPSGDGAREGHEGKRPLGGEPAGGSS